MNKKKLLIALIGVLLTFASQAQTTLSFKILDKETQEPLAGATVFANANLGAIADAEGIAKFTNLTTNSIRLRFSFIGYETQTNTYSLPYEGNLPILIFMEHDEEEMEEVIITTTRDSRNIEDIPTRIEFLGAEELQEKTVMRSANIAMLLRESTGIQMQVTSPSSANQSIRIQGLDGRYTQLMKDGFPLYSGFSGGLSIMQIPPLDLQQVEVIKGSNSTLYGGGAIAGLVNLVSIRPAEEALSKLMFDQTTAGGTTINGFHASENGKWAYTVFGSAHKQNAFDANDDQFSDLPETKSFTVNPTLFYNPSESIQLRLALNGTFEDRLGGTLSAIENKEATQQDYLLANESKRMSYQLSYSKRWDENRSLTIKNSLLQFDRQIGQFQYTFDGQQTATFSEATYTFGGNKNGWQIGANLYSDQFSEGSVGGNRGYSQITSGVFIQQNTQLNDQWFLETGLRMDFNNDHGLFTLPRLSVMYKTNEKLTFRLGGGLGYKLPTVFTEDAERLSFNGIDSFDLSNLEAERSYGGNFDINYKTTFGSNWTFSINQLFFYTELNQPLVLQEQGLTGTYSYQNADGSLRSQGLETNLKLTYNDFKLFLNYALIDTELGYDNINNQKPLTAKHNIGAVLVYEEHEKWRIGLESYYTGRQFRSDYSETNDYWLVGFMALRKFEKISLYVNFENFTDTRQSRFENINLSNSPSPDLLEVWAPMDGFILNGGIILEF